MREREEEGAHRHRLVCHTSVAACDSDGQQEKRHLLWLLELTRIPTTRWKVRV